MTLHNHSTLSDDAPAPSAHTKAALTVLADLATAARWRTVVTGTARLVESEPILADPPTVTGPDDPVQSVLTAARAAPGPVLLLPSAGVPAADSTIPLRLLVPVDGSDVEGAALRPFILRAERAGASVEQIHVLSRATRPAMWDGPGHHAAAFLGELRHRHQVGASRLSVTDGDPAATIAEAARHCDLVVLGWQSGDSAGRAPVLRALVASLAGQVHRPILLLPVTTSPKPPTPTLWNPPA